MISENTKKILNLVSPVGLLMIAAAVVVPLLQHDFQQHSWYKYLFAAGAVIMLVCRLFLPYTGTDMRLKRLFRIEAWAPVFFCVATFFLFWPQGQMRDWLAFTLAGGVIQIITSIAIPMRQRKIYNDALAKRQQEEDLSLRPKAHRLAKKK